MPNYGFTILIRQDVNIYYIVDIISRLIYKDCVSDNEEGHGFYNLNILEWRKVLCISVCRLGLS